MKALIDADLIAFRCAATAENEDEWIAHARADILIQDILFDLNVDEYELWLSGKSNFRYSIYPEYKANRLGAYRPKWEKSTKQYLADQWQANESSGCEADDMLGVRQYELKDSIIVSIDKDMKMIEGEHYNFVKKERFEVNAEEAIRWFYYQLLVGDTADGIKGVAGIGPKKADRILLPCTNEAEYFQAVRDAYSNDEYMLMTGQVLWIWRKMNDIWKFPEGG